MGRIYGCGGDREAGSKRRERKGKRFVLPGCGREVRGVGIKDRGEKESGREREERKGVEEREKRDSE